MSNLIKTIEAKSLQLSDMPPQESSDSEKRDLTAAEMKSLSKQERQALFK